MGDESSYWERDSSQLMSGKHYMVEKILDRRLNSKTKKHQYLIKWEDYPKSQSTWEPESHLIICKQMVLDFNKKLAKESILNATKAKNRSITTPITTPITIPITNIEQCGQADPNAEQKESEESDFEEEFKRLLLKKAKGLLKREKEKKQSEPSSSQKGSEIADSYKQENDSQTKQGAQGNKNGFRPTALRTWNPPLPCKEISTNTSFEPCENCRGGKSLPPSQEDDEKSSVLNRVRSIDCDSEEGMVIRGMFRSESQTYMYRVVVQGKAMVKSRQWVIKNDPVALIKYYEKNIKFRAKS